MGLVALFSEDYDSSVSYYTGPSKYNLSDPCRQCTTSTSLNFQTSEKFQGNVLTWIWSRVEVTSSCTWMALRRGGDQLVWSWMRCSHQESTSQTAFRMVRTVRPVYLWEAGLHGCCCGLKGPNTVKLMRGKDGMTKKPLLNNESNRFPHAQLSIVVCSERKHGSISIPLHPLCCCAAVRAGTVVGERRKDRRRPRKGEGLIIAKTEGELQHAP